MELIFYVLKELHVVFILLDFGKNKRCYLSSGIVTSRIESEATAPSACVVLCVLLFSGVQSH